MKTRVTFRIADDLASSLRQLKNQTQFVESALREALGRSCPVCRGSGRVAADALAVSDFRDRGLPPLDRAGARQLKELVRVGRDLAATEVRLDRSPDGPVSFSLRRGDDELLHGALVH